MTTVSNLIHCRTKKPLDLGGSVAIIGSSDLLSGGLFGSEIDQHEHVFRFNLASLDEKYKESIGSKADFFFFSQNITTHRHPHPEPLQTHFRNICRTSKVICYPGHTKNVMKYNKRPYLMVLDIDNINEIFTRLLGHGKWSFSKRHQPRNGIKLLACLLNGICST